MHEEGLPCALCDHLPREFRSLRSVRARPLQHCCPPHTHTQVGWGALEGPLTACRMLLRHVHACLPLVLAAMVACRVRLPAQHALPAPCGPYALSGHKALCKALCGAGTALSQSVRDALVLCVRAATHLPASRDPGCPWLVPVCPPPCHCVCARPPPPGQV